MPPPGQDCWKVFVTTQPPEVIAKRIQEDSKLVSDGKTPSLTVYHLPKTKTPAALAIAAHLAPSPDLSRDTKFLLYENLLKKIRRYLEGGPRGHWPTFYNGGDNYLKDGPTWDASTNPASQAAKSGDENGDEEVTDTDLSVTLKVLQHLLLNSSLKLTTPISAATALLEELLEYPPHTTTSPPPEEHHNNNETSAPPTAPTLPSQTLPPPAPPQPSHRKRLCYI
ncbi:hypothetical protein DBV05_g12160, partial [Lasiodiplodia theobromae]